MKNYFQKISGFLFLILLCLVLGPELYIFAPELLIFLDAVALEYIIGSAALLLTTTRESIIIFVQAIIGNPLVKKYGILIPFVFIAPFMPELVVFMDIELLLAFLLMSFRGTEFSRKTNPLT